MTWGHKALSNLQTSRHAPKPKAGQTSWHAALEAYTEPQPWGVASISSALDLQLSKATGRSRNCRFARPHVR